MLSILRDFYRDSTRRQRNSITQDNDAHVFNATIKKQQSINKLSQSRRSLFVETVEKEIRVKSEKSASDFNDRPFSKQSGVGLSCNVEGERSLLKGQRRERGR